MGSIEVDRRLEEILPEAVFQRGGREIAGSAPHPGGLVSDAIARPGIMPPRERPAGEVDVVTLVVGDGSARGAAGLIEEHLIGRVVASDHLVAVTLDVDLGEDGIIGEIFELLHIGGMDPGGVPTLAVIGTVFVSMPQTVLQTLQLKLSYLVDREELRAFILAQVALLGPMAIKPELEGVDEVSDDWGEGGHLLNRLKRPLGCAR